MRPLLLDLFCGRGGWSRAAQARGWRCVGYDIVDHGYGGLLVRSSLPIAIGELSRWAPSLVVASPPCEEYARRYLPWLQLSRPEAFQHATDLLRWSVGLVGQFSCPVVVECSRFAARVVPGARLIGSYALWGDVPALVPEPPRRKSSQSGLDPARRAMIEPVLAEWIIEFARSKGVAA